MNFNSTEKNSKSSKIRRWWKRGELSEGSLSLAEMTQRLYNTACPHHHPQTAPDQGLQRQVHSFCGQAPATWCTRNDKVANSWRSLFQRVGRAHNRSSLLAYLFPNNVRERAKLRIRDFRHLYLPRLRHRAQSRIYRYLVARNTRKQQQRIAKRALTGLRRRRFSFSSRSALPEDARSADRLKKMAYTGSASSYGDYSSWRSETREPGARRKKLGEYLKAANEIRQSYFSSEDGSGRPRDHDVGSDTVFPDAAVIRSGNEEMILFPSYGRKHVKSKLQTVSGGNETEQEFWRKEWDKHQNDTAVVDIDVRGWIYIPHRGPLTRKQRLFIGMCRQMTGLPAPPTTSQTPSRASSPNRFTKQEEALIAQEAEQIVRRGEEEEQMASRGRFSENPNKSSDKLSGSQSRASSPSRAHVESMALEDDTASITPQKRTTSWAQPAMMSAGELQIANNHLLNRTKPFMSNPVIESPVSAFFYNDVASRQHTVYTDTSGHFTLRAALDFVPTHVRVFAGEKLSVTEEVKITPSRGVSLISDIDDTIKHSAISAGAREIFRNAFIRDFTDLTIDGVKEWYSTMSDMDVKLHYVSNSPWQMYPVLTSFFKMAHLPKGSFHLKQYAGMLQGIFEPVAERKKSSLEKIMRDFPDRKFILVGDSGEADLEVYTDVALDNPGRILGIFIRDVTTSVRSGYFDSFAPSGSRNSRNHSRHPSGDSLAMPKRLSRPEDIHNDDADLQAAISASIKDMEDEARRARRSINPDAYSLEKFNGSDGRKERPALPLRPSERQFSPESPMTASPEEDLIDFSDPPQDSKENLSVPPANGQRKMSNSQAPPPKPKPQSLRSPPSSQSSGQTDESSMKQAPPRPSKPSSAVQPGSLTQTHQPSPLSQVTQQDSGTPTSGRPPLPARPRSYRGMAKDKLASVYNALPSTGAWAVDPHPDGPKDQLRSNRSIDNLRSSSSSKTAPPPPPPRRTLPNSTSNPTGASAALTARSSVPRPRSNVYSDDTDGSAPSSPGEGVSRKEYLWQQRWARSCGLLEPQGVTLRTWRVGSDVADVCVRLAEMEFRDINKSRRDGHGAAARR